MHKQLRMTCRCLSKVFNLNPRFRIMSFPRVCEVFKPVKIIECSGLLIFSSSLLITDVFCGSLMSLKQVNSLVSIASEE